MLPVATRLVLRGRAVARRIAGYRPPFSVTPNTNGGRFLFIAGLHRSGTSVLYRMLRSHPMVSGFTATGVPEDEGQHLQSVIPRARHHGGPGHFALDPRSHLDESSGLVSTETRDALLREWGPYLDLNRPVWLEKSPSTIVRSRFFQALFPESSFAFIVRHPLAVALATKKWTSSSVVELLFHWRAAHERLLYDVPYLRRARVLRYEDFVACPRVSLARIYSLMGLSEAGAVEPTKDYNAAYFSEWGTHSENICETFSFLMRDSTTFFGRFGYLLSPPYVRAWEGGGAPRPQVDPMPETGGDCT